MSLAKTLFELARFGIVGLAATIVHAVSYALLVTLFLQELALANIISFLLAFGVSWLGHNFWTFQAKKNSSNNILKFLTVTVLGLLNNIVFTLLLVELFHLPKLIGVFPIILITPLLTYILSKYWVFR